MGFCLGSAAFETSDIFLDHGIAKFGDHLFIDQLADFRILQFQLDVL